MNRVRTDKVTTSAYGNLIYCFHTQCSRRICIVPCRYFVRFFALTCTNQFRFLARLVPVVVHNLVVESLEKLRLALSGEKDMCFFSDS
jgi:hypothetical protein